MGLLKWLPLKSVQLCCLAKHCKEVKYAFSPLEAVSKQRNQNKRSLSAKCDRSLRFFNQLDVVGYRDIQRAQQCFTKFEVKLNWDSFKKGIFVNKYCSVERGQAAGPEQNSVGWKKDIVTTLTKPAGKKKNICGDVRDCKIFHDIVKISATPQMKNWFIALQKFGTCRFGDVRKAVSEREVGYLEKWRQWGSSIEVFRFDLSREYNGK